MQSRTSDGFEQRSLSWREVTASSPGWSSWRQRGIGRLLERRWCEGILQFVHLWRGESWIFDLISTHACVAITLRGFTARTHHVCAAYRAAHSTLLMRLSKRAPRRRAKRCETG